MYIGSTDVRGLHHLVWEVVDNSIDEAMAGFADRIEVTLHGRRRPCATGTTAAACRSAGTQTGKDALEVVHTVLHAGGKFGGGGYKVSGGLHGVGVSVVNALSAWLKVEIGTRRQGLAPGLRAGQAHHPGAPSCGAPTATARRPSSCPTARSSRRSTGASRRSAQRLRESAYLNKGVWITLRDERETPTREKSFYFEGGLISFVRHLNKDKRSPPSTGPVYVERQGRLDQSSRSPCSTTTATPRTSSPSPTTSTPWTAAPTSPASARR